IPRRERRNGQGGRLLVAHVVRRTHGAVLVDDHVFSQPAGQRRAEAVIGFMWAWFTVQPPGVQVRIDPITHLEARDTVAERNHSAGGVADRDQVFRNLVRLIDAIDDGFVAKVERDGADFYQQLASLWFRG